MKTPMIGAAMALLTACAAQAYTEASLAGPAPLAPPGLAAPERAATTAPAPVAAACDIRETKTANGVRLDATVRTNHDMPGTYDFEVTAKSRSGASDIAQGGPVDLRAGRSETVGSAEISARRYRAVLTLTDADGELCRLVRSS